ncbi:hypothetical protein BDF20DRAFT_847953 [Mycotypha africana]|uniref:uncharacterized protein n=1 Tax=Mycotypha africana TaxID=64632 RepID=UPI002301363A|nr:uncharacterized protein BDF20DRAFT_847953 [Mycotypha africana]KAI8992050.1 hypothetical protein BDF20DRAFT_847953 [Mycotypha africana]
MSSPSEGQPGYIDALKTVKLDDFKEINKIPCARNSLLYGIVGGVTMGAIRFALKRSVPTSANWAVGSFCGISVVTFEACNMDRKRKLEKLKLIVKATDSSKPLRMDEKVVVTERGKNGAFNVMIETPPVVNDQLGNDNEAN